MIYKYYSNLEYLLDVLQYNRIYMSTFNQFNDPYERMAIVKTPKNGKSIYHTMDGIKDEVKTCCFSEDNNNYLMWSHYANEHKGCCLGFDFSSIAQDNEDITQIIDDAGRTSYKTKVSYIPFNPIFIEEETENYDLRTMIDLCSNKFKCWDYENEVRIINYNKKEFFFFPKECLKELVFGEMTNEAFKRSISTIYKNNFPVSKISQCSMNLTNGTIYIKDYH